MNTRFPVLSSISGVLKVFGWIVVIVGFFYALYEGLYEPTLPGHRFSASDRFQLIAGFGVALNGFVIIAFSEIILVLLAIEENTRMKAQQDDSRLLFQQFLNEFQRLQSKAQETKAQQDSESKT